MILPTSIPYWQKIVQHFNQNNADLKLNVDPFNGKHGGTIFYKDKTYAFKLEMYPKNMVVSLKDTNIEIFNLFSKAFEFEYSVIYETSEEDNLFKFHSEWYFKCTTEEIEHELNILANSPKIKIIKINFQKENNDGK